MASAALKPEEKIETPPPQIEDDGGEAGEVQTNERDYETEARSHGWVPQEEFKGDKSRWVDAETFAKRADEVMPLLRKQNDHLKRELADVKRQARRLTDHFTKAEERIRTELTKKMEEAVESGDLDAFRALKVESDELNEGAAAKGGTATAAEAREAFDEWREANNWYDKANLASASEIEISARLYADRMTEKHLDKTKTMPPAEFFEFIGGLVEEKYPTVKTKAASPRAKPASDVAPATTNRGNQRAKGWADMDPEERRVAEGLAEKWVRSGLLKSKDDYLKGYDWNKK